MIGETEEEKDIGVQINKNMKPSSHCSKAAGRATAVLRQLTKHFHYRDRHTFVRLYIQYVRPHLEFSSPAWSPWLEGDKQILEKVQQKAVRMVSGLSGTTYEEKCTELGLETLERRRDKQDMVEVYRDLRKKQGSSLFVPAAQTGARTRMAADPANLRKTFARTDSRKYFFSVRAVEKWNSLPGDVKQAPNHKAFKKALNKAWKL